MKHPTTGPVVRGEQAVLICSDERHAERIEALTAELDQARATLRRVEVMLAGWDQVVPQMERPHDRKVVETVLDALRDAIGGVE